MQTIRRIYLYVMSGIALGVIGVGLSMLLEVILTSSGVLQHPFETFIGESRQRLSQAIALLGVGVPVWAAHWWFVQRGLSSTRPGHDDERGSAIRALYLSIVLLISLVSWVNGAIGLAQAVLANLFRVSPTFFIVDPVNAATALSVGLGAWVFHGLVRRRDLAAGPAHEAAAWLPRLYLYGVALGALVVAAGALESIIVALVSASPAEGDYQGVSLLGSSITLVGWGIAWLGHWRYTSSLVAADDWRGSQERLSRTRLAALIATIFIAAGFTLTGIARTIEAFIRPVLGLEPGGNESWAGLIAAPLGIAVPWAIAWFAHARWLHREPASADALRGTHVSRIESHGVAAVALAFGAVAFAWLLGLAMDTLFGGIRTSDPAGFPWRAEFATWLSMAVVGLAIWAWQWSIVVNRRRSDPEDEANSTIRRTFLYLTMAVALVAGLGSATVILYRVVGSLLGATLTGNAISELSTPLGAVLVAAAVLVYHGLQLRRDQTLRREAPAVSAPAAPAVSAAAAASISSAADAVSPEPARDGSARRAERDLVLVGPRGADLDAALAAARAVLPEGIRLEEPSAEPEAV
ncbi:MAG: DUF5671 domain-containing protein [Chloroflexota bacterium]